MIRQIRYFFLEIKWFIQRGKRGWADCDVWAIDSYLNRVIPAMLENLANCKHGAPPGLGEKRWATMLRRQASYYRDMEYYKEHFKFLKAYQLLNKILRFSKRYYFHLWD